MNWLRHRFGKATEANESIVKRFFQLIICCKTYFCYVWFIYSNEKDDLQEENTDDVATAANSNKRTASEVCLSFYFIKKAYSYPKHNKSVGNMTETKGASVGFLTKASGIKAIKTH